MKKSATPIACHAILFLTKDKDIEVIRDALKVWRQLMAAAGVACTAFGQSRKALEALERIERRLAPRQLGLEETAIAKED